MLDMLKSMLNEIKNNSLFAMFSHKNITIAGIIVIAVYMIRIRYYPINLSIENGVTLLLVSYISGIFYVMLWCAIISLGWTLSYITKEAYNLSQIPMLKPADKLFWIEKLIEIGKYPEPHWQQYFFSPYFTRQDLKTQPFWQSHPHAFMP